MPKSKSQSNREYKDKIYDAGFKRTTLIFSPVEYQQVKNFMDLHSIKSYRELIMKFVSYYHASFTQVVQIPYEDYYPVSHPLHDKSSQFTYGGKFYEVVSIQDPKFCIDINTGEIFSRTGTG